VDALSAEAVSPPLIVGVQRAIEVDNRRTVGTAVLGVGKRPIIGRPDAALGAKVR
jgi:hypothetical protein